jgi:hypothetical protein
LQYTPVIDLVGTEATTFQGMASFFEHSNAQLRTIGKVDLKVRFFSSHYADGEKLL